jgi:hypothetical protein
MTDEPADGQQVSVAELLARNGQRVSTGGRRRRGMAGGISVAELTGEIPVVQDEPEAEAAPAEPARPEPVRPEPARPEPPRPEVKRPEPVRPAPPKAPAAKAHATKAPAPTKAPVKAPVWPTEGEIPDRPSKSTMDTTRTFAMAEVEPDEDTAVESGAVESDAAETALIPKLRPEKPARKPAPTPAAPVIDDAPDTDAHAVVDAPPTTETKTEPKTEAPDTDEPEAEQPEAKESEAGDLEEKDPAPTGKRSPLRQWAGIVGQGLVAIVMGAALFKGFERLWDVLPWVALVLAFFVIVGLVAVVRVLRRTDDIVSILLAVLVGGFVTLGPLAFILSTT